MQMARFAYQARGQDGQTIIQNIEAEDRSAAEALLNEQGLTVAFLYRVDTSGSQSISGGIRGEDFILFNRHLASVTQTKAPLPEGMRSVISEVVSGRFRMAMEHVLSDIENGKSLSAALEARDDIFSDIYISLVRAGETSGDLARILSMPQRQRTSGSLAGRRGHVRGSIGPCGSDGGFGFRQDLHKPERRDGQRELRSRLDERGGWQAPAARDGSRRKERPDGKEGH
jgi:hypothetical protein